jgi:hypothetical protein
MLRLEQGTINYKHQHISLWRRKTIIANTADINSRQSYH